MSKKFNYKIYFNFLNILANQLTRFYYSKLDKPFKISNKLKGKGYDPVTTSDKAFERFIRKKFQIDFQVTKSWGGVWIQENKK